MPSHPAVFLDRDGTLNVQIVRGGKPYAPDRFEDFKLFDGVAADCQRLKDAGYLLVVATNQPEVGRGTMDKSVVERMHAQLRTWIPAIDRVEACYDPGRGEISLRRKPAPGMLLDAAQALEIDISRSWMIGDRWRDTACGKAAGVKTVFIDFGYDEPNDCPPDYTVKNFSEAVSVVLGVKP
jgi:D-glycero-D-manno-heptose 1,7-bisphosphate phosphatase